MTRCLSLTNVLAAATVLLAPAALFAAKPEPSPEMPMTLQRFDDVEALEFDWGWIRWLMNSKIDADAEMTFGLVYIKPNQVNPKHFHPNSAEYLHVIEGSCEHLVGDKWVTMKAGDTIRIPKNAPHRARTKDQACRCVIVYDTGDRQMVTVDGGDE